MPNFHEWLKTRRVTDNPRGDFIDDARTDSRFPAKLTSWRGLEGYLHLRGACPEAKEEAKHLWRQYKKVTASGGKQFKRTG